MASSNERETLPSHIGPYTIEGILKKGGMSLLYLAKHPKTFEPIVIKVLSKKFLSNKEVVSLFLKEAEIISLTDHPNIVKLYDYGAWEDGLYIAMEFIKGITLRELLNLQPCSVRRALDILLQIAYALCHLHTHQVIHGDLKPENILITADDKIKIIDFGIAKILKEKTVLEGKFIGTPIYMSPEATKGPQELTFQSDIYSLGILAYELVLGKIPHGKIVLSLLPKGLQPILKKALQPIMEDRYQDTVDFIADLSDYLHSEHIEEDRHGSDYFFEVYEKLESFQQSLTPKEPPSWQRCSINMRTNQSFGLYGLYYDFFELSDFYIIIAAEIMKKGVEGLLFTTMLYASVRALLHDAHAPDLFFEKLQNQIAHNFGETPVRSAVLFIDKETLKETFFSSSDTFSLTKTQRLLLAMNTPSSIQKISNESQMFDSEKQLDHILTQLKMSKEFPSKEDPFLLINIDFS